VEGTAEDYKWALVQHLLPFFVGHRLSEITVTEVDRYKTAKLAQGRLNAATINKTLTRLGQILEEAVKYEHLALERNPVRVGKRKLKVSTPNGPGFSLSSYPLFCRPLTRGLGPLLPRLLEQGYASGRPLHWIGQT
jgi:hypothetical protein